MYNSGDKKNAFEIFLSLKVKAQHWFTLVRIPVGHPVVPDHTYLQNSFKNIKILNTAM